MALHISCILRRKFDLHTARVFAIVPLNKNYYIMTIVYILGAFMAVGAVLFCFIYQVEANKQKARKPEQKSESEVKNAVTEVLRLSDHLRIVEQLQYEETCKEELMQLIHDLFFFQELKNPEWLKNTLRQNYERYVQYDDAENQALARMFKKIMDDLPQNSR